MSAHPDSTELSELRARLAEAQATLEAIRCGAVDGLVGPGGKVFQRVGADKPYATFFDAMNEGGVTLDRSGAILHCNPRFALMVGRPVDALRGSHFAALLAPTHRAKVQTLLAQSAASTCEAVLDAPGGALPVQISLTTMDSGGLAFCCVVVTDLSERARLDEELRIAAIAFESQEATMVTDANARTVRVNRAFSDLTGFSAAQAVGQTPAILRSGRQDQPFYQRLWAGLLRHKFWQGEIWNRHQNGRIYPHWLTISAVCSPSGEVTHYVGVLSEITKNKEAEAEIHRLAYYDPLTGLPNRRLLLDRLSQALLSTARSAQYGAILFLDLDNFKTLNDTRGHDAGDALLREVARRLRGCVRELDTIARLGGDEFLLLVEDLGADLIPASLQARHVGEKIRESLASPFVIAGHQVVASASIGVSMFRDHELTVEELLKHSDLALYKAKESGRNTLRFFDPMMQATLDERVALEMDLRQAVERDELFLVYQAQVDDNRQVIGAEVLLRWQHPERGLVAPKDFIPMAEKSGQILHIGTWVLRAACAQLQRWAQDPLTREVRLAVNVSQRQFQRAEFVPEVKLILAQTGARPALLKIELTESMLIEDIAGAIQKMQALNAIGIGISIDDFGTGYSSLSYLMRLPIEQLKIDQSFVMGIPGDPRNAIITRTIIDMARNLSFHVIAEGVETPAQFKFLVESGCHAFQGYLFSQPLGIAAFEDFLRRLAGLPSPLPSP